MYKLSGKQGDLFGILDTKDGVTEFYSIRQIGAFLSQGIKIQGVQLINGQVKFTQTNKREKQVQKTKNEFLGVKEFIIKASDSDGIPNDNLRSLSSDDSIIVINKAKRKSLGSNLFHKVKLKSASFGGNGLTGINTMRQMFFQATIGQLDVSGIDTSAVVTMMQAFDHCTTKDLDLRSWDTKNVQTMNGMFAGAKIQFLNMDDLDLRNIDSTRDMFSYSRIQNLSMRNLDLSSIRDVQMMFSNCVIEHLDLTGINFPPRVSVAYMFYKTKIKNFFCDNEFIVEAYNNRKSK